jgi:hypothetical protein
MGTKLIACLLLQGGPVEGTSADWSCHDQSSGKIMHESHFALAQRNFKSLTSAMAMNVFIFRL